MESPFDKIDPLIKQYEQQFGEPVRQHRGYPRDMEAWAQDLVDRLEAALEAGRPDPSLHKLSTCPECGTRWNSGEGCIVIQQCPRCGHEPKPTPVSLTSESGKTLAIKLRDLRPPGGKLRSFFDEE